MASQICWIFPDLCYSQTSNIVESFELSGERVFVEHWIRAEFDGAKRHVAVNGGESVDTLRALHHVDHVGRQHFRVRALWALEFLPGGNLKHTTRFTTNLTENPNC